MTDILAELQAALGEVYTIQRELSGGAMGRVFVARETALGRDVVIKVLKGDHGTLSTERFHREIAVAARLRHPNIVPVLSSGEAAGHLYYTMPFIRGQSLREVLKASGRLSVESALQYAIEIADALSHAHAQGIIHRDIKPENVLIDSGHAVITDFGLARAVNVSESAVLTHQGIAVGTPLYMSPEQISGDHEVDGRTDIFSLACVLYEMLTGGPPFTGETMMSILASRFRDSAMKIRVARPEVPARLAAAVEKALASNPDDRFGNADRMVVALKQAGEPARSFLLPVGVIAAAAVIVAYFVISKETTPVAQTGMVATTPAAPAETARTPAAPQPTETKPIVSRSTPKPQATTPTPPLFTNGTTADLLRHAVTQYENLDIEGAISNLRWMTSMNYLQPVLAEERVRAFKYLGAAYADIGKADSARAFFMAALAYDPFSDLSTNLASATAIAALRDARRRLFVVAATPFREHILISGNSHRPYSFRIGATQQARIRASIVSQGDSSLRAQVFEGLTDTTLTIAWDGKLDGGAVAEVGRYELRIDAAPVGATYGSPMTKTYPFRLEQRTDRSGTVQVLITPIDR